VAQKLMTYNKNWAKSGYMDSLENFSSFRI